MGRRILVLILLLSCLGVACRRQASVTVIERFGSGLQLESLNYQNGEHAITLAVPSNPSAANYVIPGNILWCKLTNGFIIGQKLEMDMPAPWMDPVWELSGYFILEIAALDPSATSDERIFGKAVTWFDSKEKFDAAVKDRIRNP